MELTPAIMNAPKVGSWSLADCARIVTMTFARKMQDLTENQLKFTANEVYTRVREKYSYLTTKEIEYACEQGAYGAFGEVYKISAATIFQWLDAYSTSEARCNAIRANAPLAIAEKATVTTEEADRMVRDKIVSIFLEWQKTGMVRDTGGVVSGKLHELGLLRYTQDELNRTMKTPIRN